MIPVSVTEQLRAALSDRYAIERELGRGGMATVYLAHDLRHERRVALKVLRPDLGAALGPERFTREIKLAAGLQHPHIVSVYDSGSTSSGQLWFTMPYVEGESLRERLRRQRQLSLDEALRLTREIALALDYAHRHGVVHRDIKPENILLVDGQAMVADFGVARALAAGQTGETLTQTGTAIGTPAYMSPEQAAGEHAVESASDVYSLGVVLYEMLAGEPPYTGPTAQAIVAKMMAGDPPSIRRTRSSVPPAVDQAIHKALSPVPADRYATGAEFARALETAERTAPVIAGPAPPESGSQRRRRFPAGVALLGLGFLVGIGALFAWRAHNRAGTGVAGAAGPMTLAVLPFENLGDSADVYFADGMTDEVRGKLGALPGIQVVASTSTNQYRHTTKSPEQIGRELGVRYLLVGRVRWQKAAGKSRVRVDPELVEVADVARPTMRWEQPFDADLADVFRVQADIAEHVVTALRVVLDTGGRKTLEARPTNNLEAYDLYLKGRYAWNQRTSTALLQAVHYFEQAIARDPRYAQAYAGLADAYVLLPGYGDVPPAEAWPKSRAAAQQALALDSTLAEAHASLGLGKMYYEWDWKGAEQELRRAIALDPKYATGHQWYGDYLGGRGRLEESLAELQRAQSLDPLSRVISLEVGRALGFMHRYGDAVTQFQQTIQLDPNFPNAHLRLGLVYLQLGRQTEAVPELQRGADLDGRSWNAVAYLAYGLARSGDRGAAAKLVGELRERARRQYVPPTAFAIAYTGLGDHEQAFKWLNTAVEAHEPWLTEDLFDPMFDPLRSDARFREVRRRLGLE